MDPFSGSILGGLISGIGSIFGSQIAADAQGETNATSMQIADMQRQQQDFYAQNGISIRANDARRAGVNVNTALGGGTPQVGMSNPNLTPVDAMGQGVANAFGNMGQAISRALTQEEQNNELNELNLERARLDNDLLRSQISIIKSPGRRVNLPSAMGNTVDGQGNTLVVKPAEVVASSRAFPSQEPGAINEVHFSRGSDGAFHPIMSSDFKQRSEDSLLPEAEWFFRNRLANWNSGGQAPGFSPGEGKIWKWDTGAQGWRSVPRRKPQKFDKYDAAGIVTR